MDRRLAGGLILIIGLFAALVVPLALSPGIDGVATRAPVPEPPPIGACLATGYVEVPCDQEHVLEVIRSWSLDDPDRLTSAEYYGALEDCYRWIDGYRGSAAGKPYQELFYAGFNGSARRVQAPLDQMINGEGWQICVLSPAPPVSYQGNVQNVKSPWDQPSAFGTCRVEDTTISCLRPHNIEVLGTATSFIPDEPAPDDPPAAPLPPPETLKSVCAQLADELMQRPSASTDGLTVELVAESTVSTGNVPGVFSSADCQIRAPEGITLVDSLIGIGDKPLPVA